MVVANLVDAVAAELLEEGVGQHDRHHGLAHDAGRGNGADVAALHDRLHRFLGGEVHRLQRSAQRGQRLHGGAHHDGLAVGDAALEAAGIVRGAIEAVTRVKKDLVVHTGTGPAGRLEAHPEFAALDGLDRAEGLGEPAVEPSVPLHVGAEPDRAAHRDDLEYAPQRVPLGLGVVDRGDHRGLGHRDPHRRLPVLPVAVGDAQRDRRAEGGAPADAGQDVDLIALDLHASTAAVAALAPGEVAVDIGFGQRQAGRDAVDDGDQCLTVGFARGEEAEDAPHARLAYRDDAVPVGRLARGASRRSTLGVTKMTSSRFGVVCTRRDLNSQPRTGMSPNTGTLRVLSRSVRCVMPPITSVSPSLTSTSVSARRLLMIGTAAPPPAFTVSPAELSSTVSFILMRFTSADSYTTVGVTSSRSAASLNWICVPAELTVAYGISLPSTMDALAFSTVTISGLDSERVFVWFSSACSARFKLKFVPMMPNERPPAGRFEGSRLTMLPPRDR